MRRWAGLVLVALAVLAAAPVFAADKLEVLTLSNRPELVSGGDVLVKVVVPGAVGLDSVRVRLNAADVTSALWPDTANHALVGLVTGLRLGKNSLEAKAKGAGAAVVEIVNHPLTGPTFSGPQEKPFYCQTHQFRVYTGGPFLTASPIDDPCVVPTRVDYVYRSGSTFKVLPPGPLPSDVQNTTTVDGHTVPYIVRIETGTINRATYQTAILDDPSVAGPDLQNHADLGWNGRLVYTFGGGCGGGHYIQGSSTGGVLNDMALSRGFAVASASLNVLGTNCNHVTSAETMMMVKERFIESYGPPRYTIGWGCSGGGIQQYMITDNYPGLLDGLLPQCSFSDVYAQGTFDARLMLNYYAYNAAVPWTQEELRAASGFGTFGQIFTQGTSWAARIDPSPTRPGFPPVIPGFPTSVNVSWLYNSIVPIDVRYDPVANPTGARATTYDHNVNALGRDERGFARRPLDNVGVQYGLAALNAGQISKEQFLDLNEKIGGLDIDANFTAERMVADRKATRALYETGMLVNGGGGLGSVPILDFDLVYTDLSPAGDVHMKYYHFTTRERIAKANGHADNMVMWNGATGTRSSYVSAQAFLQMDAWLANIAADSSDDAKAVKVVRNKPSALVDGCWSGDAQPFTFTAEPQFLGGTGSSSCNSLYPGYTFPRYVAGMPLANDVVACRLKPIDPADYAVALTAEEVARLRAIFPTGVCDFTRQGLDQRDPLNTWLIYEGDGKYHKSKD